MPIQSPFHPRTTELCHSLQWKEWAGYAAVCSFDAHSEREYFAVRHSAGLLDVSPLYKYELRGPDAADLLSRVMVKDIRTLRPHRVTYCCWCDAEGKVLDDGTVARLDDEHFRVTASESWLGWFRRHGQGMDVRVEDSTARLAALALQGPRSREILAQVTPFPVNRMRFFRVRQAKLAGIDGWISRTGYTGDLGFELWVPAEQALTLWDALVEAGRPYRLEPMGLDALDVTRIEAGFILQGVDYVSARSCIREARKSSPFEIGLGGTVDLDREPFVGQEPLIRERARGSSWALVGLELSWPELEALYDSYGLPAHLAPCAWRDARPVYDQQGQRQVGQATSGTWSPTLKKSLALATVPGALSQPGTRLRVEHTVEFERRTVTATVVPRPFFDPPRKRTNPAAAVPDKEAVT